MWLVRAIHVDFICKVTWKRFSIVFNKKLTDAIIEIADKSVPISTNKVNFNSVPWWTNDLTKFKTQRNKLRNKLKKDNNSVNITKFKEAKNK